MPSAGTRRLAAALVKAVLVAASLSACGPQADAAPRQKGERQEKQAAPEKAPAPPPVPDVRPYDAQLLRLAEILGALTTMRQLCGAPDAEQWRGRMQALLDAEGNPPERKDRLAGAYNRGAQGYGLAYRTCTANAKLVIERFLAESVRLARDIGNRYRAS